MSAEWHRGCQLEEAWGARTVFKDTLFAHDTAIRLCSVTAGERGRGCGGDSEIFAVISGNKSLTQDGLKITSLLAFRNQTERRWYTESILTDVHQDENQPASEWLNIGIGCVLWLV